MVQKLSPAAQALVLFPSREELRTLPLNSLPVVARRFTEVARCVFCYRPIPSFTAYALKYTSPEGKSFPLPTGPNCARKWGAERNGRPVPDLTLGLLTSRDQGEGDDPRARLNDARMAGEELPANWRKKARTIEYLLLRTHYLPRLVNWKGLKEEALTTALEAYRMHGDLSEDEVSAVRRVMNRPNQKRIYSYRALSTTYAFLELGRITLKHLAAQNTDDPKQLADRDRLTGILGGLKEYGWMTSRQCRETARLINLHLPRKGTRRERLEFDTDAYMVEQVRHEAQRGRTIPARTVAKP